MKVKIVEYKYQAGFYQASLTNRAANWSTLNLDASLLPLTE